jgi:hypothetical protein
MLQEKVTFRASSLVIVEKIINNSLNNMEFHSISTQKSSEFMALS